MQKVSQYLFLLLKNTFVITAISLLLAWAGGGRSLFEGIFGTIGFYGAILTINLFILHLIVLLLSFLFSKRDAG